MQHESYKSLLRETPVPSGHQPKHQRLPGSSTDGTVVLWLSCAGLLLGFRAASATLSNVYTSSVLALFVGIFVCHQEAKGTNIKISFSKSILCELLLSEMWEQCQLCRKLEVRTHGRLKEKMKFLWVSGFWLLREVQEKIHLSLGGPNPSLTLVTLLRTIPWKQRVLASLSWNDWKTQQWHGPKHRLWQNLWTDGLTDLRLEMRNSGVGNERTPMVIEFTLCTYIVAGASTFISLPFCIITVSMRYCALHMCI